MMGAQLTFDDVTDFSGKNFTDPALWSFATKTPSALHWAGCARCGKRPETLDPLPDGWRWDTMEPTNPWCWCPHAHLERGCKTPNPSTLSAGRWPVLGNAQLGDIQH